MELSHDVEALLHLLREKGALVSPNVESAFCHVHRHRFIEDFYLPESGTLQVIKYDPESPLLENLKLIYSNRSLITSFDGSKASSSTSQPSLMARMLERLDLSPGLKVLEIGLGTRYDCV